jgi:hypothetical protein
MPKTTVKKHPRKGTKGVKQHSRTKSTKNKRVNPLTKVRHMTDMKISDRVGPVEAIWKGQRGMASMYKETSKDIFSGEIYEDWYVGFRKHGIKLTDPLSKRMGKEIKAHFKTKGKALKFFDSIKVI